MVVQLIRTFRPPADGAPLFHFTLDGFHGVRALLDDIRLVQQVLEEVPETLGLSPVMPPFLLPYYNGVEADDCGVSAFVFLAGGHLTLHTFSVRECYFVDLVYPEFFEAERARRAFSRLLPADSVFSTTVERGAAELRNQPYEPTDDFGPHLFLDIEGYSGADDLDTLFSTFERLPSRLGMTPIMRPYVIRGRSATGARTVSAMTMIAESHVALHVFPDSNRAYFDIFSCKPFDVETVTNELLETFRGDNKHVALVPRGRAWTSMRREAQQASDRASRWLQSVRDLRIED